MHTPPPDPTGTPRPATPAGGADGAGSSGKARPGSTGSHRTADPSEPSLSDLLRRGSGSSRKGPSASDIAMRLSAHAEPAADDNSDDAPTVITQNGKPPAPPPPPYVVGEAPSVAGRRLGHFELIEAVGSGGMAAVLRARDLELGRVVALKILPPEATHDAENVTRFKQEARAAAKLDHENIARVYFCGEDQGLHFIAFEFVEGITLRQMIDRRGPLPAGECLRYMIQVAAGLAHASERGVVHRDIKPSNVIITPDRRAKIVDMGLARHLDSVSVNGGVTQSGVTLGTFDYISPEQAIDPRQADVRSDIYSLGCAFYHALTGRPPVPEGTAAKKLHAHQHVDPVDPRELNPTVPDEAAAVLARMMAKDPARRYQTPADLIAHLKGVAERLRVPVDGVVADSAVHAVAADPHVLPEQPRVPWGWVAALAGVAVAVAALVIATSGTGPSNRSAGTAGPAAKPPAPTPPATGQPQVPEPGTTEHTVVVHSAKELADALARPTTTRVKLVPGQKYDLTALDKSVTFEGKQIEIIGHAERPPLVVVSESKFALQSETISLKAIRFELHPTPELAVLTTIQSGLTLTASGKIELADCTFIPAGVDAPRAWVAAVAARAANDARPEVTVSRCVFGPGAYGLLVSPGSRLHVADSGFGPSTAAVYAGGGEAASVTEVTFDRTSFMLDPGSAAVDGHRDLGQSNVVVRAAYCVFAQAGGTQADAPKRPAVLHVEGAVPSGSRFEGTKKNAYYGVDPVANRERSYSFDDCQRQGLPFEDKDRVVLRKRPWDAAPGGILAPFATDDPYRAFRLQVADPDVFATDDADVRVFGARFQRDTARLAYRSWPPAKPATAAAAGGEKTWDPNAAGDALPPGHYKDLVKLLRDVRSGDTILVAGNGPVEVERAELKCPVRAEKADFRLTIKPAPGSHPVLVCSPSNNELDAALFRLFDGEVEFQGLHFQVRVAADRDVLAAVGVIGGKKCTFTRCVFDLDDNGKTAAAVSVADPKAKMMLTPAAGRVVPRIEFDRCLVRGRGRGVSVPDGQPFDLDVRDSVTAVYGPVIQVNGAGKDVGGSPRASVVKLARSTLVLGGPVVELHAGRAGEMRGHGLAPLDVSADGCLFAAVPLTGRALAELNGFDPKDVAQRAENSPLRWATTKGNRYANFDPALPAMVVRPPGGETEEQWAWSKWVGFAGEPAGREPLGKVTFAKAPAAAGELAGVVPANLAVKAVEFPDLTDPMEADFGPPALRDVAQPVADEED